MFASFLVVWLSLGLSLAQPNFIVLQPDDLPFFEQWTPPAHYPTRGESLDIPSTGLPHIERLRQNGLAMGRAYAASSMCGTSRYSTITGRYPSRSSFGRNENFEEKRARVIIPTTKLEDLDGVQDGYDCRDHNVAALLSENGYHTGVVGKWHLSDTNDGGYKYSDFQEGVRGCGFDFAESLYAENMGGFWHDGTFSHNQEYVTAMALKFIKESRKLEKPFFLYMNPTVPHESGNVYEALTEFDCTDTPAGKREISSDATAGMTCKAYRDTVIDRANGSRSNVDLGAILVDDAVGAILQSLEDNNELDNTFFLFQIDHGREGKGSLYEPGTRIAQFIHYPDAFGTQGMSFDGLVSTIDIGPTILDYAGIKQQHDGYYEMDGESWKTAVEDVAVATSWKTSRCLAFELRRSRSFICGCDKYMAINDRQILQKGDGRGVAVARELLFNLCDSNGEYLTSGSASPEITDLKDTALSKLQDMKTLRDCHLNMTNPSLLPEYSECTIYPTTSPTTAPTTSPSPPPTEDPSPLSSSCADEPDESFRGWNGVPRTCEWAGKKDERCKINRFGKNCPVTCGHCPSDTCVDAPDGSFSSGNGVPRTCEWAGKKADRCRINRFGKNCPVTCGHCPSGPCVDAPDGSFRSSNGKERDCLWVSEKEARCTLDRFGGDCPVTCGYCTP